MKSSFLKTLTFFLILSLVVTLPTSATTIGTNDDDIIDGGDSDYIYDYDKLEAPPMEMNLYPHPITNFEISINDENLAKLNLETVEPVKFLAKSTISPLTEVQKAEKSSSFSELGSFALEGQRSKT